MPDTDTLDPITYSDGTQAAIDAGVSLADPTELSEGLDYAFVVPAGGSVEVVRNDLDEYRDHPRRKQGTVTVHDAASFLAYVAKHGLNETELWADVTRQSLTAVVNAHQDRDGVAGWGDHRAVLRLIKTPAWLAWSALDRQLLGQVEFAEHLEQRLVDIVEPAGADMLELAQTFSATRSVAFESSKRLSSGQVNLGYREEIDAKAGTKGQITIPESFTLALAPFEGSDAYKVTARLRYRLQGPSLAIGYVLDRPEDILSGAFDDVVSKVSTEASQPMFTGTPD